MARFIKDRSDSKGLAPGSLVFIGKQKMEKPILKLMEYDANALNEFELESLDQIEGSFFEQGVSWLNIYGIHDLELAKKLGEMFKLPPLLMEDIVNTDQRPKHESYSDFEAVILKMMQYDHELHKVKTEQLTLILGKNYIVTLQEQPGDVFEPVRQRIRQAKGRIRSNGNGYLAFALLDTIVDNYLISIETLGGKIEELENKIFHSKDTNLAEEIYKHKTELNYLRKSVRPAKEALINILKNEDSFFSERDKTFIEDLNDQITQASEAIELYNNLVSDQLNIYNTNVSNGMNQVMKVLTIFASIFIPLTFLAGIYGMNFEYIPELQYKFAYPVFWGLTLSIGIGLLIYFRKKKWL